MMRTILKPAEVADLRHHLAGWSEPLAVGWGLDGGFYAVARRPGGEALSRTSPQGTFPKSQLDQPIDYRVVGVCGGVERAMTVRGEGLAIHHVQPIADGVLLVGARCDWRPSGPEANAVVVGWDAVVRERFVIGDGIEDVRVTGDGTIWVSYFDEGVFGNRGWGGPGPEPIGAPGLVAFGPNGDARFRYDPKVAGTDAICDAYAINVTDAEVWLFFYTEFSLVRIRRGTYAVWKFGQGGARALAVDRGRVLLYGGDDQRNRAQVLELRREGCKVVGDFDVVDETGRGFDGAHVAGVGPCLFFFREGRVFELRDW